MKLYKTYEFRGQDPVVREVLALVTHSGMTKAELARQTNVASSTVAGWRKGKTKRPQFATLQAVARSCGSTFRLTRHSGSGKGG